MNRILMFVVFCVGLIVIVAIAMSFGLGDMIYSAVVTMRLEAQAQRDVAKRELLETRNERMRSLPLVVSALSDTTLSVVLTLADRVLLIAIVVYLLKERRNDASK